MTVVMFAATFLLVTQSAGGTIEGTVVSAVTNLPIPAAQVIVTRSPAQATPDTLVVRQTPVPPVTTDANGHFVLTDLQPGTYLLRANADAYAPELGRLAGPGQIGVATTVTLISGQTVRDIIFHLMPGGTVSGRITVPNGRPAVATEVMLLKSTYDADGQRLVPAGSGQTDDRGEYRLYWVTPGRYYLSAGPPTRPTPMRPSVGLSNRFTRTFYPGTTDPGTAVAIDIPPGGELSAVNFELREQVTYRIRGRIANAISGLTPLDVSMSITARKPIVLMGGFTSTNPYNRADGTFEFRDVVPGSYWIRAQELSPARPQPGTRIQRQPTAAVLVDVVASDLDDVVLTMQPPVSVTGHIRVPGESGSSFVEGLSVVLTGPPFGMAVPPPPPARTNAEGVFQINNVEPGDYKLKVIGVPEFNGYLKEARLGSVNLLLDPLTILGPIAEQIEIVFADGAGQITGMVLDDREMPVSRAQVVVVPGQRDRRDLYTFTSSDANGRFKFETIPPGPYKLFAFEYGDGNWFFDPDVLRRFEQNGVPVNLTESSNVTIDVKVSH